MKKGRRMLTVFDGISLSLANTIYTYANFLLVFGAVSALIGTLGVFWSGGIKDRYSDERISKNEAVTADANRQAALANEKAAQANERAANSEKDAEQARLQTEKLRQQFSGRRLTTEQSNRLVAELIKIQNQVRIVQIERLGDMESNVYATDIWRVLNKVGFRIEVTDIGIVSPPPYGVFIFDTETKLFTHAFSVAGIDVKSQPTNSNDVKILVGLKPPPF